MSCYLKGVRHIASVFRICAESKHVYTGRLWLLKAGGIMV